MGPLSIVRLPALVLRCELPVLSFSVSPRLPIGKCFLPPFLIDVDLKLSKFQARSR